MPVTDLSLFATKYTPHHLSLLLPSTTFCFSFPNSNNGTNLHKSAASFLGDTENLLSQTLIIAYLMMANNSIGLNR